MGLGHAVGLTHTATFPVESNTACFGQIFPQTPHSIQEFGSMEWTFPSSPVMDFVGHFSAQAEQPTHTSVMLYATLILPIRTSALHDFQECPNCFKVAGVGSLSPDPNPSLPNNPSSFDQGVLSSPH